MLRQVTKIGKQLINVERTPNIESNFYYCSNLGKIINKKYLVFIHSGIILKTA